MQNNIMLIGLGPHAKRIYIKFIKKHKLNLKIIIDLDINKKDLKTYLIEEDLEDVNTYFIKKKKLI